MCESIALKFVTTTTEFTRNVECKLIHINGVRLFGFIFEEAAGRVFVQGRPSRWLDHAIRI